MRPYVYRKRADGLAILNTNLIEKNLNEAIEFIKKFEPEDIVVVCKREAGWKPVEKFSEVTGIKAFTKKYPAGIITNINLPKFFEPELVIVTDPWLDKNALNDATKINKKIVAFCDTNNILKRADVVVPCNNKSNKSIGLVYYLIAREYIKAKGMNVILPSLEEFIGEKLIEPGKAKAKKKREEELEKDKKRIEELAGKK
jgi:small subunit ribosomal protein S2